MANLLEKINKTRKTYQISDIADIKYGFGLPERDRIKGSIPVYASSGLVGYHNTAKVYKSSIIIGRKGNVGSVFYAGMPSYPIDTAFFVDETKKGFDLKYLYFLFKRIDLPNYGGDSAVPGLSRDTIYSLSVKVPELFVQQKIASILSAYDAKIENNNKIIKNLETTAQTIFEEWFVKFNFPIELVGGGKLKVKSGGYKSRGGKMVESEMGKIPEGWGVGKVKDLIRVESGFPFSSHIFDKNGKYKLVTIRNVQDGAFVADCENFINVIPNKLPDHCRLISGDILLSLTGNVGRVCLVNGQNYVLNQRVSVIIPVLERDRAFTYFLFRKKDFQDLLISISKGTAQLNLSPVETRELQILIPNEIALLSYGEIINPMLRKIVLINEENQKLKESRDQLLEKLI